MSDHDWVADPDWPRVVTEAAWKPGLPPPIEALQTGFRPDDGWEITYETWIESREDGPRSIPVATARHCDGRSTTFFPAPPSVSGQTRS